MNKLILSTDNKNKILEIKEALQGLPLSIYAKSDYLTEKIDVDEKFDTLEENAKAKAEALKAYVKDAYILSDDTGLFIEALNGEPGVHSARYAKDHNDRANIDKVLDKLKGKDNRSAYFKTIFYLITPQGEERVIEGICPGQILKEIQGKETFGYDPIFQPQGKDFSFGQMTLEEKNQISHRGKALKALKEVFKELLIES